MGRIRKRYDGVFKARVALAAINGDRTTAEIASQYSVHPNQVAQWKKQALDALPEFFSGKRKKREQDGTGSVIISV
jgi:transposase